MSKVVFSLTAAQVAALLHVEQHKKSDYSDYGACRGLVERGMVRPVPRVGYRAHALTEAGRAAVELIKAAALDAKEGVKTG